MPTFVFSRAAQRKIARLAFVRRQRLPPIVLTWDSSLANGEGDYRRDYGPIHPGQILVIRVEGEEDDFGRVLFVDDAIDCPEPGGPMITLPRWEQISIHIERMIKIRNGYRRRSPRQIANWYIPGFEDQPE